MFGLDNLMDMLFDSALESINRNERVIQLLKRLKLDPDHPPEDFTGVYQYALVEYGVGKPRPVLEIFRRSEIQQLFREALEQNNPSKLLQRGEAFLADSPLQADLQASNVDVRREFYAFAAVFIEVAKRTRTPAEILAEQKLESLHRQIGSLQERLNRLPTIEGLRTEMARLAAPSYPALPGSEPFNAEQCKAFALAQQMRGWFETLGFDLESHEVWQDDYFEWIINIPVRRGRYDRILVRGIDGEAGLSDVEDLKQSVETHRTDEGWLVTARRISRAARDQVEKAENEGLGCYTLDELLDQDADFSGYLTWLETEIQKRGIDQKYVPLACLKEEIDPDTQQRIGVSRYDDRDGWIDGYIDLWLDDPAKEHISVLGEFGTGKTWFALHYAWKALQRYREAQRRGLERPRLPLVIPLRDYAKAVSVESLFSEFFFRKHEIPIPGYSAFEQLNRMGKLLLIFDGFDEMAARVDRQEMINNFWELAKVVVPGAKVILTCRTEHFPDAKEGRALLNAELQASTRDLTGETPQFEVLELEKFNDEQIRRVLEHQAQPATVEQIMGNPQLLDLARRPVLTELILEALPDIEAGKPVDMSRVYLYAVRHKMERDIKAERTFTSMADKLYFMCELSWEMLSTDRMSINYREFPDRIRKLFGPAVQEEKDLDHWHYDMMGQTMLIRNADGDYSPAHRSLLEFFVAYKFAAELGALQQDFVELVNSQHNHKIETEDKLYTWSEFFNFRQNSNKQKTRTISAFKAEPGSSLRETIGRQKLDKATLELAKNMIHPDKVWSAILRCECKDMQDLDYSGGNGISLLSEANADFKGKTFVNLNLRGARFNCSNLDSMDFSGANLSESEFINSSFVKTTFLGANLDQANFSERQDVILAKARDSDNLICLKNGWIYDISQHDFSMKKILFMENFDWNLYFTKNGSFFLATKGDNQIRLWQRDEEKFYAFNLGDLPIKGIAYTEPKNILVLLRGSNVIELWKLCFNERGEPKKLKAFCSHDITYGIGYFELLDILVTSGRDINSGLSIKTWDLKNESLAEFNSPKVRIERSQNQHVFLEKEYIYVAEYDRESRITFSVYKSDNGAFLAQTEFKIDLNIWAFESSKRILFHVERESLFLHDCISSDVLLEIPLPENLIEELKNIFSTSIEEENKCRFFLDFPEYIEGFYFDLEERKILESKIFLKGNVEEGNSLVWDEDKAVLTLGGQLGGIYLWDYNSSSLLNKKKLRFEYEGMSIQDATNLDYMTLVWLKRRGIKGLPDIDWETKIKACLILSSAKRVSGQKNNEKFPFESLIFKYIKNDEFLGFVGSLDDSIGALENESLIAVDESGYTYYPERKRFFKKLDDQVSSVDWELYPELLKSLDAFLSDLESF